MSKKHRLVAAILVIVLVIRHAGIADSALYGAAVKLIS